MLTPETRFYDNPDFLAQGWDAIFPGHQGLNLEIGCGYGHFLGWLAPQHPQQAFIGLDIVNKVLRRADRRLSKNSANNVVLAKLDALHVLRELIAPASLDHLYILFPDPWFKESHKRRRTLREDTLTLFASRLKAGGRLLFVSDDPPYAADALALLEASPLFAATDFPPIEVKTKYENKWLAQNKAIHRLAYTRVPHPPSLPDLPDTGVWPGYAHDVSAQIADWGSASLSRLQSRFQEALIGLGPLTLKLQSIEATSSDSLRLRVILIHAGSLAQNTWLELDVSGKLRVAADSRLPFVAHREAILERIAGHLGQLAADTALMPEA